MKTWKKRWFVLQGDTLFYFKTQQDADLTGTIPLEFDSECKEDTSSNVKGKKYHFTVSTSKRTFVIFSDKEEITKAWVNIITQKIKEKNAGTTTNAPSISDGTLGTGRSVFPRKQISLAKGTIPFLMEQQKPREFWQMWFESIPPREELQIGTGIEYVVQVSANLEKLTWRMGKEFLSLFLFLSLFFFFLFLSFSFFFFLFLSFSFSFSLLILSLFFPIIFLLQLAPKTSLSKKWSTSSGMWELRKAKSTASTASVG